MSKTKLIFIFLFLQLVIEHSYAQNKKNFNIQGLSENKNSNIEKPKEPSVKSAKKYPSENKDIGNLEKIAEQINAINLVAKSETNREKKIDLYLRKSQLLINEAKLIALQRGSNKEPSEKEKSNYKESRRILNGLLAVSQKNNKRAAIIYYLFGLIDYEQNLMESFKKNFRTSLSLDSKGEYSATMTLILGEQEYDEEKYEEAIKTYQMLYSQMSDYQKAVADYKTAWSYIALENKTEAKRFLLRIIRAKKEQSFVEDSMKDLAFVSAQSLDENQLMTYGIETFTDPKERAQFYYLSLLVYFQIDKKKSRKILFDELMSIQKDPYERAKILALNVSYQRKEFPSVEAYKAINDFDNHFGQMDKKSHEKFLFKDAMTLEEDSEAIIRFFADGYAGRITSPQLLKKDFLGQALKRLIAIHLKIFTKTPKKEILYSLWIDTCADTKDQSCLFALTKNLRDLKNKEPQLQNLYSQSYLELINLVDEKFEKDPSNHENLLISLLENFLKEFPNHPEKKKLAIKLSSLYIKKDKFKEALPILLVLYQADSNLENYYKLQFARFKLEQYSLVLEDPDFTKFQDSRLLELKREISLKQAQKGIEKGNFVEYENNLKIFLASNPEKEKAMVAYKDYFTRLIKAERLDDFLLQWNRLSSDDKKRKDFEEVKSLALSLQIEKGDFKNDKTLFSDLANEADKYQIILIQRSLRYPISDQDYASIKSFSKEKRNYILNLIALTQPKFNIDYYSKQKKLDEDEQKIIFLSFLILKGHSDFKFSIAEIANFKDVVPEKMWPSQPSTLEKEIDSLVFPNSSMQAGKYNKIVEKLVEEVKKIRKKSVSEISKLKFHDKVIFLKKLEMMEKKTAESIDSSPLPSGLSGSQVEEYKIALKEISKDFENQSLEFSKIREQIQNQKREEEEKNKQSSLQEINLEKWGFAPIDEAKKAVQLFDSVSPAAAIIFLDQKYANKKISIGDYYRTRSYLLLKISNTQPIRDIIAAELQAAQQTSLLQKWKEYYL